MVWCTALNRYVCLCDQVYAECRLCSSRLSRMRVCMRIDFNRFDVHWHATMHKIALVQIHYNSNAFTQFCHTFCKQINYLFTSARLAYRLDCTQKWVHTIGKRKIEWKTKQRYWCKKNTAAAPTVIYLLRKTPSENSMWWKLKHI